MTLADLLSASLCDGGVGHQSSGVRKTFQKPQRMALALTLATAFFHTQGTPWLTRGLNKDLIEFMPTNEPGDRSDFTDPLICSSFGPSYDTRPTSHISGEDPTWSSSTMRPLLRSKVEGLYELGVILIELAMNKRLEDMIDAADQDDNGNDTMFTPLLTAERLSGKIASKCGIDYGDAVKRCIHVHGMGLRNQAVAHPEFRRAFHGTVLVPLQSANKYFTGGAYEDSGRHKTGADDLG